MSERPTPHGESDGPGCPVSAMRPAERPTPITDAVLNTFDGNAAKLAADLATHAENLERHLAEARKELAAAICERDNALSDWRQADSDTVRALHERNEARAEIERLNDLLEKIVCRHAEQEEQP